MNHLSGYCKRVAWSFPYPSKFTGADEEILAKVRTVRDEIKEKVMQFIEEASSLDYWLQDKVYEASEE